MLLAVRCKELADSPQHEGHRFLDDISDVALLVLPQHIVTGDPVIDPHNAYGHHFRCCIRDKPLAATAADIDEDILDTVGAARVLAAAIQKLGADMVVFGRQTLDTGSGLTAAQTARVLGWPMLGLVGQIKIEERSVSVERVIEEGRQSVKANLPAVLSVVQSIGEPRYPSFMGIRKAGKATIPVWSLSDLGMSAPAAVIKRSELLNPPAREMTIDIITGDSPEAIAETLVEKILAEKVL